MKLRLMNLLHPRLTAVAAIALLGFFATPQKVPAQSFYGSIVGTVTDNSGAVVSGATVTVTNLGTNDTRTTTTGASGEYRVVNLVPANYSVVVESTNFKRFQRQSVQVAVNNTVRIDASLTVGTTTETVEVSTATPLLQTESGSLSDTVQAKQVAEMPLNGRNTMNLMALVPGVVPQGHTGGSAAMNNGNGTASVAWGNYQIGGGLPFQSSMYIDGSPIQVMQKNTGALVPVQDVIQEFKVETGGVNAEFGRFGGGVVNMTTKSGTNSFHGTAYEYIRNNVLNANGFFQKRAGLPRPQWNQNQFGGAVGGPIWKNKVFFFGAYEAIRIRTSALATTNIPTAAMQNGIIPEVYKGTTLLNSNVTDPRGKCVITHQPGTPSAPGTWTITNLASCEDPTAKIFASFYPTTPMNANAANNYNVPYSQGDNGYQLSGRVDYNITKNNSFFARFTLWPTTDLPAKVMPITTKWDTTGAVTHNHTNQLVTGDTYTINPTTILDVRADYLRQYGDALPPGYGNVDEAQFGPPFAAMAPYMTFKNIPAFSFNGAGQLHNLYNFGYSGVNLKWYNNYHLSGALTKIVGRHTLKMGGEGLLMQRDDVGNDNAPSGSFAYGGDLSGDEWANFLMGYFDTATIQTLKATTTYTYYHGYYIQDTWQALPKLTLTLGGRVEWPGALAESGNNAMVLLPSTVDPNTGIRGTAGLVASSLYGPRTTTVAPGAEFGPRFGFAYRVTNNTAIRGGYSLSYLPPDAQIGEYAVNQPINAATTVNRNTNTSLTYTMGVNPFPVTSQYPNGFAAAAGRSDPAFMKAFIGQAVSAPYPYSPYPHSQSMNLSIGHQFPGNLLVDIGGTHTLGTHLPTIAAGLNQLPDQYDVCGTDKTQPQCNGHLLTDSLTTKLAFGGVQLPNSLQNYGQTLRPYPAYSNYSNSADYHGTSSYNGLEVKVQKRFTAAGQIGLAYTWSKLIGNADTVLPALEVKSGGAGGSGQGVYQDYTNLKAERSLYSFNVPDRLAINYVLNLPFGRGQRYAAGVQGVSDKLISGWSVNGITTFQSGFPLYLNTSGNNLSKNYGAGTIRPNYAAGCAKTNSISAYDASLATPGSSASQKWFNTSCFSTPGSYSFGNEPRVDPILSSQGIKNFDFSVVKSTPVHEQVAVQFRVEFFNIFNTTQFAPPVTQTDNTQFGLVINQANNPRLVQGALRLNF